MLIPETTEGDPFGSPSPRPWWCRETYEVCITVHGEMRVVSGSCVARFRRTYISQACASKAEASSRAQACLA